MYQSYGGDLRDVAKTSELSQSCLRHVRQPAQLRGHEIGDVVGEAFGANAVQIPRPGRGAVVEYKQRLLGQSHEELNCEERIAVSLLVHQLPERPGNVSLAVKRIGDELPDIVGLEGSKHDLLYPPSRLAEHFERPHQRVRGID